MCRGPSYGGGRNSQRDPFLRAHANAIWAMARSGPTEYYDHNDFLQPRTSPLRSQGIVDVLTPGQEIDMVEVLVSTFQRRRLMGIIMLLNRSDVRTVWRGEVKGIRMTTCSRGGEGIRGIIE